ncbi:glycoside hydrolase family 13 protein [Aureitalea marina]|uniref:Glucohydrolase n=1 Tax=Aureitalea marina TaxID=930804 RepID=A0A2S7KMR6_9FLAO|nr:alpha-glucosidase [Aureitalea marina]PQB03924.1 glucohydrolase [Aureitalea marina]
MSQARTWWKEGIVYQIYPRSFNDSNDDGIGDLQGIIQKLDYIASLGVTIIWLCPVYPSPNDDNGYDISDYRGIMPEFGTMEKFDQLLEGIHKRGMRLVMDLVANHSSDEHHWFKEAQSSKDNPYRDYYFWKPGKMNGPPNDWPSFFGGNAWEYDELSDEYYLHLFTRKQPDLNWENPQVRKEIQEVIRYWFEKGVDGFRMDVISVISKDLDFPDAKTDDFGSIINNNYANGSRIHEFLQEMNREVLSKYDIMTVGEGPGISLDNALDYVGADREELNMVFHFDHMFMDCGPGGKYDPVPVDFQRFKEIFSDWDSLLSDGGWGSIFLGNHDFSRLVSKFGNDSAYWQESAKLFAALLLSLRGTVYIYQGDEIGMTNVAFSSIDEYNDVETLGNWKEAEERGEDMDQFMHLVHLQSRDNARTPMQWSDKSNAGFTQGKPWLGVNPNYVDINVDLQETDPGSVLHFYRRMIAFRKENPVLVYGNYQQLDRGHSTIYAYRRWDDLSDFLVVHNCSDQSLVWDLEDWNARDFQLELSNVEGATNDLHFQPWQSKIFRKF